MRALMVVAYVVMAFWLLISSVLRVLIVLDSGSALDPLPFAGSALGLVALAALVAARRRGLLGSSPGDERPEPADRRR